MDRTERLIAWLDDAYGMECAPVPTPTVIIKNVNVAAVIIRNVII
jgi:hypothetical protein